MFLEERWRAERSACPAWRGGDPDHIAPPAILKGVTVDDLAGPSSARSGIGRALLAGQEIGFAASHSSVSLCGLKEFSKREALGCCAAAGAPVLSYFVHTTASDGTHSDPRLGPLRVRAVAVEDDVCQGGVTDLQ